MSSTKFISKNNGPFTGVLTRIGLPTKLRTTVKEVTQDLLYITIHICLSSRGVCISNIACPLLSSPCSGPKPSTQPSVHKKQDLFGRVDVTSCLTQMVMLSLSSCLSLSKQKYFFLPLQSQENSLVEIHYTHFTFWDKPFLTALILRCIDYIGVFKTLKPS